jgi:lipopolysaccharide export system protein LptA
MKKTRLALLVLLVSTIAVVVAGYYVTQKRNQMLAPVKPARLPEELHSTAKNWSWSQSSKDSPMVEVRAHDVREVKDSSRLELIDVELKVFSKAGDTYDLIRSKKAEFDQPADKIYSDGEVTIVLGLPAGGPPEPGERYVEIKTSGLAYDNKSGVASTDRPVHFQFENGEGNCIGAVYDASKHYLWMKSQAEVIGAGPQEGMHIRAGELHYYEADQKIELRPWSRLERGEQGVEAGASTVYLDKGDLKRIEAPQGKGWDNSPTRQVRFGGDSLEVNFTPQRTVGTAAGVGHAQVVSESATGVTRITGDRVDLEFTTPPDATDSELSTAFVRTHARVESVPAVPKDKPQPEAKILQADMVKVVMRPGGRDVQAVETLTPGELDFLPNQPSQWKRTLTAARISAQYQPGNRLDQLRAVGQVQLRSDPPASAKPVQPGAASGPGGAPPPRLTWSDDLQAFFDPQTGQMKELRQWHNFRYEEGLRRAQANGARYDPVNDRLTLDTAARVWDASSMTTADLVVLDQKQDRLHAEGNVTSTHSDSAKPQSSSAAGSGSDSLFSSEQPMHATAQRFDAEQHNTILHYFGSARLWQDGNSVQAQEIDLDRNERTLHASGGVVSILVEDQSPAPAAAAPAAAGAAAPQGVPRLVTITADSLLYTDAARRAYYTGNVVMHRDRMLIHSGELEAFLRPQQDVQRGESRIERLLARNHVDLVETAAEKRAPRHARAEQAEYLSGDEKVTLRGGTPSLEKPGRGSTKGAELTYYIDDDRLLVNGSPGARSETHQKLKRN